MAASIQRCTVQAGEKAEIIADTQPLLPCVSFILWLLSLRTATASYRATSKAAHEPPLSLSICTHSLTHSLHSLIAPISPPRFGACFLSRCSFGSPKPARAPARRDDASNAGGGQGRRGRRVAPGHPWARRRRGDQQVSYVLTRPCFCYPACSVADIRLLLIMHGVDCGGIYDLAMSSLEHKFFFFFFLLTRTNVWMRM